MLAKLPVIKTKPKGEDKTITQSLGDALKANTEAKKPAKADTAARYVLAKKYNPKTERNTDTWNKIVAALGDGPKTLGELTKAVETHKDFVGYMVRGGHIAPQADAA